MNVLWLTPEPPLPPYSGGRERSRRMLGYVAERHAVHLMTYAEGADEPELARLRPQLAGLTALPYPARGQSYSAPLRAAVRRLQAPANGGAWHTVHVQGLTLWPAAVAVARARCVLDLFDLPRLLQQRLLRATGKTAPWEAWRLAQLRQREAHALRQASAIVVTSTHDAGLLRRAYAGQSLPLVTVPNGVDLAYWQQVPADCAPEPATLLFPAGLNYPPNLDAARVLVNDVLPRVRAAVPAARVLLAGRAPVPEVVALARGNPNVSLQGDVSDMRPLMAGATLVVVPLRAGSGTRLKILQALAAGRPVVSTPLGAEGLDLAAGRHLSVAPLVDDFAAEVVRLLGDVGARAALAEAGPPAAAAHDWSRQLPALDALY